MDNQYRKGPAVVLDNSRLHTERVLSGDSVLKGLAESGRVLTF